MNKNNFRSIYVVLLKRFEWQVSTKNGQSNTNKQNASFNSGLNFKSISKIHSQTETEREEEEEEEEGKNGVLKGKNSQMLSQVQQACIGCWTTMEVCGLLIRPACDSLTGLWHWQGTSGDDAKATRGTTRIHSQPLVHTLHACTYIHAIYIFHKHRKWQQHKMTLNLKDIK